MLGWILGVSLSKESPSSDPLAQMLQPFMFSSIDDACNFILSWDGTSTSELLTAIRHARQEGDRFQQDTVLRRVARMPFDFPRPTDIPIFIGSPVWVVDREGNALVGMPGDERIEHVDELRKLMESRKIEAGLLRNDTNLL